MPPVAPQGKIASPLHTSPPPPSLPSPFDSSPWPSATPRLASLQRTSPPPPSRPTPYAPRHSPLQASIATVRISASTSASPTHTLCPCTIPKHSQSREPAECACALYLINPRSTANSFSSSICSATRALPPMSTHLHLLTLATGRFRQGATQGALSILKWETVISRRGWQFATV